MKYTQGKLIPCFGFYDGQCTGFHIASDKWGSAYPLLSCSTKAIREGKITAEEMQANGYLFAAAPDMLKALKDVHPHIADDRLRTEIGKVIMEAEGN